MSAIIHNCDVLEGLKRLPDESVQCCVTSPPYWGLRDYGVDGQLGLEGTPDEYIAKMVSVFAEVRRVLRDDGTLWLNMGIRIAAQCRSIEKGAFPAITLASPRRLKWAFRRMVGSSADGN